MPGKRKAYLLWPEGHRECLKCGKIKTLQSFHRHNKCALGYNSICKSCRVTASKNQWEDKSYIKKMYDRCKTRATQKNLEFNIDLSDIIIPEICPIFKKPIKVPSLDRIDSSKGYIKGNIRVVENRANTLKNNATLEELRLIYEDGLEIGKVG